MMWTYAAALVRVIDGDTYVFDIDQGFSNTTRQHIRLKGIDCPEIGTPEGKAAQLAARTWFESHGNQVLLTTSKAMKRTFTRYVGDVSSLPDGNPNELAQYLRALGHFKPDEQLGK